MHIRKLNASEKELISTIAQWYHDEWNTPLEKTIRRLTNQPDDDVYFQLVLTDEDQLIATGGVANKVNILNIHPDLNQYGPWITLLYTDRDFRGKGLGGQLLHQMEVYAKENRLKKLYLYTFTAESFYKRAGWKAIATVWYKNHETVVMEKEL